MGYILASGQEAATAAQRVYEILDTEPAISAPGEVVPSLSAGRRVPGAAAPRPRASAPASTRATGHLVFDRVRFSYPGGAEVLRGVCLALRPGETVALVGATGSGKTTLLQLVPRLADVTGGTIRLDGTDIRDLPLADLRSRIGCAFEDPTLFSASVRDNVGYGAAEAAASRAEIEAAATAIGADTFIGKLPGGYDEPVGTRGSRLSAGQRQLVSFARAFLAAPAVVVLDEATALLDIPGERLVQRALTTILAGRTALIIAHRLSTVEIADRVLVLEHGEIVEDGPPGSLLVGQGHYSEPHTRWRESLA